MTRSTVLVVDDKENMRRLLSRILSSEFDVSTADNGAGALALLSTRSFDVVVTDIKMPGADGFEVLQAAKSSNPDTEVILMTGFASVGSAVDAIKGGAYDYIEKPFDPEKTLRIVARAAERKRLRVQAANLTREVKVRFGFHALVGKSEPMQQLYRLLERAARTDITVLLTGGSGTGKELGARAVHFQSARSNGAFVPVNCGALPADLVESELFGHSRGSFTGANSNKRGLFEEAVGGTLFLDEIGELPLPVQVKLNRALQEGEIRRVGETQPISVDVRVIAATNRDLKVEVHEGRFREDLYYRLNVFPLRIPSLRERRDDIPLLAAHFLEKHVAQHGIDVTGLEPEALRALTSYEWPGNVRELENAIERAVVVADGALVGVADLPLEISSGEPGVFPMDSMTKMSFRDAVNAARDHFSRDYLAALMREFEGNVTHAAERAGVERESLHRLLKKHGVRATDFRGAGDGAPESP